MEKCSEERLLIRASDKDMGIKNIDFILRTKSALLSDDDIALMEGQRKELNLELQEIKSKLFDFI